MSKRPEHICNTCIHFGVRTCCDKAVCAEQNWDDSTDDDTYGDVENFLWEMIPDNQCDDWTDKTTGKQKWTKETPTEEGLHWLYMEVGKPQICYVYPFANYMRFANGHMIRLTQNNDIKFWWLKAEIPEPPIIPEKGETT